MRAEGWYGGGCCLKCHTTILRNSNIPLHLWHCYHLGVKTYKEIKKMKPPMLISLCIAKEPVQRPIEIPFYCHTEDYRYFSHYPRVKTVERIEYLASRRNGAVKKALELFPQATHIFMIDTYYLDQKDQMRSLIREHASFGTDCVLGASTWYVDPSRIPKRKRYWDTWTNPEFLGRGPKWHPPGFPDVPAGWQRTTGAGGFCIFPRWVWEKQKFGVPYPFPESGCEANYLSRCDGVKTYISFNTKAWRSPPEELRDKPFMERLRTTLSIRTRLMRRPLYK